MIDTLGVIIEPKYTCRGIVTHIYDQGFRIRRPRVRDPFTVIMYPCSDNMFSLYDGTSVPAGRIVFYLHNTGDYPAGTCIAETELGVLLHGDNNALLSFDEVRAAAKTYVDTVCRYFPWLDAATTRVRRADFYYQLQVNGDRHSLRQFQATWKSSRVKNSYVYGGGESTYIQRTSKWSTRVYDKSEEADDHLVRSEVAVDVPKGIIRLEMSLAGRPLSKTAVFAEALISNGVVEVDAAAIVRVLRDEFPPILIGNIANALDMLTEGNTADMIKLLGHDRGHLPNLFLDAHASSTAYHRRLSRQAELVLDQAGQAIGVPDFDTMVRLFRERDLATDPDTRYYVESFCVNRPVVPVPKLLRDVRPALDHWSPGYMPVIGRAQAESATEGEKR